MHYNLLLTMLDGEDLSSRMEPFSFEPKNPEYLEFENMDGEGKEHYEDRRTMVLFPDGSIHYPFEYPFSHSFEIVGNKVCARSAGPLGHTKLTRPSKKYKVLLDYPVKKLYKNFDDFMERHLGYEFNQEEAAYGSYYNPNGQWDYYDVGGRWPYVFLVKEDVPNILGDTSTGQPTPTPEGYRWVAAAFVRNIEFDLMREMRTATYMENYQNFKNILNSGISSEGCATHVRSTGLFFQDQLLLKRDESLEEYLIRNRAAKNSPFHMDAWATLDRDGQWDSQEDFASDEKWAKHMDIYLQNLKKDDILAMIDCHC